MKSSLFSLVSNHPLSLISSSPLSFTLAHKCFGEISLFIMVFSLVSLISNNCRFSPFLIFKSWHLGIDEHHSVNKKPKKKSKEWWRCLCMFFIRETPMMSGGCWSDCLLWICSWCRAGLSQKGFHIKRSWNEVLSPWVGFRILPGPCQIHITVWLALQTTI